MRLALSVLVSLSVVLQNGIAVVALGQNSLSPAERQARAVEALQARSADLESRVGTITQQTARMQALVEQLLANQEQLRMSTVYAGAAGLQRAADDAKASKQTLDSAVTAVGKLTEGGLPNGLNDRVKNCVTSLAQTGAGLVRKLDSPTKPSAEEIDQYMAGCSANEARAIYNDLNTRKAQILDDWNSCRQTLVDARAIKGTDLPADIDQSMASSQDIASYLSVIQEGLNKNKLASSAQACVGSLKNDIDGLRQVASASAALSSALTFASQVSFASGANPYVCGGALILAVLMNLFKGGGDGNGKGDSGPGGPSNVKTAGGGGQGGYSPPSSPIAPSQPTDFQGDAKSGGAKCQKASDGLACWATSAPTTRVILSPSRGKGDTDAISKRWFTEIVNKNGSDGRLFFCAAGAGGFSRVVISSPDRATHSFVDIAQSAVAGSPSDQPELLFSNAPPQAYSADKLSELCPP